MKRYPILIALLLLFISSVAIIQAQSDETLMLEALSPAEVPAGQQSTVNLTGRGFGERTRISLSGYGDVPTTFVNAQTLSISIPANLAEGSYTVTATRNSGATSVNTLTLTVHAAQVPAANQSVQPTAIPNAAPVQANPLVNSAEPRRIQAGTEATLTIIGSGFTSDLVVRLQGFGLIPTTFVNSGALTAQVPATVPARDSYVIELIDGTGNFFLTTATLQVNAVTPATDLPMPTEMPLPSEAAPVASLAPLLQLTGFSVDPVTIDAGQIATISFTITNRGNDSAKAISVSISSSSAFVPAVGQVAVTLPDLAPGASASGQIRVASSLEVAAGPTVIPLNIAYQNPLGDSLSATGEISVNINSSPNSSQLVIDAYVIEPSPAVAGEAVRLQLTLFNVGDSPVSQVLLRIGGDGGILIPEGRGDSIPIGDIEARAHAPVELSMLVNSSAEAGYQIQPITLSYFQDGEQREVTSNIMVNVVASNLPQPLLLLASYETSIDSLQPSSRFNLNIEILNEGAATAKNTLITFGTVQSAGSEDGSASSSSPSSSFAPLGTAGLDFVGDIEGGATIAASQEFIVSSTLTSGIYTLPITLQYTLPDGSAKQDVLNISLVVTAPPQLQMNPAQVFPETLYAEETVSISIELKNNGRDVNLQEAVFTMENGEVLSGANISLESLKAGSETTLEALVMPSAEGEVRLTLTLHYLDELNQPQTIIVNYSAFALRPEPVEEFNVEEVIVFEEEVQEAPEVNWFGRFIMAFLGLGS